MRLDDDFDESSGRSKTLTAAMAVSFAAVIIIVFCVLIANADAIKRKFYRNSTVNQTSTEETLSSDETLSFNYESTGIKVSDLDFFEMYKDDKQLDDESETTAIFKSDKQENDDASYENDGKHTLVVNYDGSSEWVTISQYLTKNEYDFTNLINQSGKMKYFEDSKCISYFGVDISKEQDYIDFIKLKKAGVNFVMIRVGARGYSSGQLSVDEYFQDNLKRASDAGLNVGLYFLSQAVSEAEAKEEANTVIASIGEYTISYPIAFVMKFPENDTSRVEALSRNDRSMIARAFLNTVRENGKLALDNTSAVCYNIPR